MLPLFRRLLPRLLRPLALRPAAATGRNVRAFASGGMFESLTSSMGATFKKLLGRKTLTREEVDIALASVHDALVDADVAQVGASVGFRGAGLARGCTPPLTASRRSSAASYSACGTRLWGRS